MAQTKFFVICLFSIDANSASRLELVLNSSFNTKNTLYNALNHCITTGGQRRLRSSILQPSSDIQLIHNRQEAVEELLSTSEQNFTLLKVYIFIFYNNIFININTRHLLSINFRT